MAGFLSTLASAANVIDVVVKNKGDPKAILNELVVKENNKHKLLATDGTLTKLLQQNTVEPFIICSNAVAESEVYEDTINMLTDLFTSWYLQAMEILRGRYDCDINTVIDVLGTDNGGLTRVGRKAVGLGLSLEEDNSINYMQSLYRDKYLPKTTLDVVATTNKVVTSSGKNKSDTYEKVSYNSTGGGRNEDLKELNKDIMYGFYIRNLKLRVKIRTENEAKKGTYNESEVEIPITVKATVLTAPMSSIIGMCKPSSRDKTFSSRWEEWRSGGISFKELMFAGDLIREYKKNRLNDKTSIMEALNSRVVSANSKLSDKYVIGFEKNYNMLVVTKEEKPLLDAHIGGDTLKDMFRDKLLSEAHALTYTVLDNDYERITLGIRDMRGFSTCGYKALKKRNKSDKNNDYDELIKALLSNRAPTF